MNTASLHEASGRNGYRIVVVCLTGGPCGGKTTARARIKAYFEPRGWRVILPPETATIHIDAGIVPFNGAGVRFQKAVLTLQKALEQSAVEYAFGCGQNVLVVFDRGMVDGAAFTPPEVWTTLLAENGFTPITARDTRYDAVFHLVTAAKGAPEYYTLENNHARTETPERAIRADDGILKAYTGHPHFRVIGNSGDFDHKIDQLIKGIAEILGIPEPVEKERKFLVNLRNLPAEVAATSYEIIQTYIPQAAGSERQVRLRRRGRNGEWMFVETIKRPVPGDPSSRFETESIISATEFWTRITEPQSVSEVSKTRAYALHECNGQTFYLEIDRFVAIDTTGLRVPEGEWAIVEVETHEEGPITLPAWAEVVEEVTLKSEWHNERLARRYENNPYRQ